MIYTVGPGSPPRYLVQGADSDAEDEVVDYKEMRKLRTQALANDIFANPSSYTFELEIKFKNIYKPNETVLYTLKASELSAENSRDSITCLFTPAQNPPIFFSYNYNARYSKATLFIRGPHTNNEKKALNIYMQYVPRTSKTYTISSLDLQLQMELSVPSNEALRTIKPAASRRLFNDADDTPIVDVYSVNETLKVGGIFQLAKAKITLPMNT